MMMNKTIKVIDLLNMVTNGEKMPKKIRIAGWCYNFEWEEHGENYFDKNGSIDLMSCLSMCSDELNREVKIIEDNDKLEKIKTETIENLSTEKFVLKNNLIHAMKKVNEIIDHINKIEEKINE